MPPGPHDLELHAPRDGGGGGGLNTAAVLTANNVYVDILNPTQTGTFTLGRLCLP